jgi:hypothetical protein
MPDNKKFIDELDAIESSANRGQDNTTLGQLRREITKIKRFFAGYKKIKENLENTGDTNAKGAGKAFNSLWKKIIKGLRDAVTGLLIGKKGAKKGAKSTNPLDLGLVYLTGLLASLDLCSIIQTIQNLANGVQGQGFNPNADPPPNDPIWKIQRKAYDIQVLIDAFEAAYAVTSDPASQITNLIRTVAPELIELGGPNYLGDETIKNNFPQTSQFNNFIEDSVRWLSDRLTISNADKENIDKFRKKVAAVRQICVLIQGLSSPASLVALALRALPPATYDAIDKLGVDNIDPDKLNRVVSQIAKALKPVIAVLRETVKALRGIQALIRILIIVVKIFKIILNFLLILPLPNMTTTTGVTTTTAAKYQKLLKKSEIIIRILNSINKIVAIIVSLLEGITSAIDLLLSNLKQIVDNLMSCDRNSSEARDPLMASIQSDILEIEQSNNEIKAFTENYRNKQSTKNKSYFGYTIEILTEKIADPAVQETVRPRRFGIALNSDGIAVVQSTATFASDDNIIISEVKLLLIQKNLIKNPVGLYTDAELNVITDSLLILGDNSITLDDIVDENYIDSPDNEDENDGLGLNAFINKLKGGKKLRERIKKSMSQSKEKLKSDLQSSRK